MDGLFASENLWKIGVLAILGVIAFMGMLRNARVGFIFLGAMIFLSGLGLTENADKMQEYRTWLYVLQTNRQLAYAGCAGLLLLGVMVHAAKVNSRTVPVLGLMVMLQGIYMGIINIFQGEVSGGLQAVVFTIFSMSAILLSISSQLKSWDDIVDLLRMLITVGAVWTLACTVQFAVDQSVLLTGNARRFVGLSGNPQHAAGLSAVMSTIALWLVLNDAKKFWNVIAIFTLTTHVIFVLWTASRTGLALTTMGFASVLYARLGRAVFFAPVLVGAGYGLLTLAQSMGVEFGFERLSSRDDTRTAQWGILWENGLNNPIIGVGLTEAGASENGFLYGFAAFGLGVPVIMACIMLVTIGIWFRMLRSRFETPNPTGKRVVDLCLGFFVMYWAGNMFEGFGVARISPQLSYFLIFACIAACTVTVASEERALTREAGQEDLEALPAPDYDEPYGDYKPATNAN